MAQGKAEDASVFRSKPTKETARELPILSGGLSPCRIISRITRSKKVKFCGFYSRVILMGDNNFFGESPNLL